MVVACSMSPTASKEGRSACLSKVATELPLASQSEKQKAYRLCLTSIDSLLTQTKKQEVDQKKRQEKELQDARNSKKANQASLEEQISYCKFHREKVIDIENQRIRAYANILSSRYRTGDIEITRQEAEQEYARIVGQLESLIPIRMRAGQPLIPEVVSRFKSCDEQEFSTLSQ